MKNILFIMADQLRADYLSYSGSSKLNTPNIDKIAACATFSACTTVSPMCSPARSAITTGKYAHQIGMLSMSGDLSLQHPTYLRSLQKAGYATYGIGKLHLNQGWRWNTAKGLGHDLVAHKEKIKKYGYHYLWEVSGKGLSNRNYCNFAKHLDEHGLLKQYYTFLDDAGVSAVSAETEKFSGRPWPFETRHYTDILIAEKTLEYLDQCGEQTDPFCMHVSFCSPHPPFDPPKEYLDLVEYEEIDDFRGELSEDAKKRMYHLRRCYKAMIRMLDDQIGKILQKLEQIGQKENTVIILTSDHGEMLGDHGLIEKGVYFEQSEHVPLAVWGSDFQPGQMHQDPVEIIDITATILDIAGIHPQDALCKYWPHFHENVPCRSLLPVLRGQTDRVREFAFSEYFNRWRMVKSKHYKYVRMVNPKEELFFDLASDPGETVNHIHDTDLQAEITRHRDYCEYIMDSTPPAQLQWLEIMDESQNVF